MTGRVCTTGLEKFLLFNDVHCAAQNNRVWILVHVKESGDRVGIE